VVSVWKKLLDLLYPPRCAACGIPEETLLCGRCQALVERIRPPFCLRCGLPFDPEAKGGELCADCRSAKQPFEMARAFGRHHGVLRETLHSFKYDRIRALGPVLGKFLLECFDDSGEKSHSVGGCDGGLRGVESARLLPSEKLRASGFDIICPVPLHPVRLRERGFNQAEVLAGTVSSAVGIGVVEGLERLRLTKPQTGLDPRARRENVRGAFAAHTAKVAGRRILLVDDVWTTGATLVECAKVLTRAKARKVSILTLTRAAGPTAPAAI
jgi:predicted amidophosphoribosyltransferase